LVLTGLNFIALFAFLAAILGFRFNAPVIRQRVIASRELREGATATFQFERGGVKHEGFVARFQGKVVAYENVCRHLPIALDAGDGQFFDPERKHFFCQSHGAIYEPLTGLCVRGPCEGAKLKPVTVREHGGFVEVEFDPDAEGDDWRHLDWR
jgi:nitrite reductase/ring-hydroxylating ferredoxin subunit